MCSALTRETGDTAAAISIAASSATHGVVSGVRQSGSCRDADQRRGAADKRTHDRRFEVAHRLPRQAQQRRGQLERRDQRQQCDAGETSAADHIHVGPDVAHEFQDPCHRDEPRDMGTPAAYPAIVTPHTPTNG